VKPLRRLIHNVKPNFEKGGKYERWFPAFEALETFLFKPATPTAGGVHVRDAMDLKRTMTVVIIALIPPTLFGMWNAGYQHHLAYGMEASLLDNFLFGLLKSLPMIIVSYAVGLGAEFLYSVAKGHPVSEGYLVTGLLIPLTLPIGIPLWMVALAAIFCTILGKEIFGGTGYNFMNPALLARVFLFFAFPAYMSGDIWTDLTPEAGHAIVDGWSGATNLVTFDANFHNLPSPMDMFLGFEQGSFGETSALACLIGAIILIATGIGSWKIMASSVLGVLATGFLMNLLAPGDLPNHAMHTPAYYHLLMGGFAFGAVYMATDPVSAAQTETGKWYYGFFIGVMIVLLRVFNPAYPESTMLVILLLNVFAPLIDHIVVERHIKKRLSRA
jgi:Na+-transporting NADH:ubiquinone oxidoreductase subunit B